MSERQFNLFDTSLYTVEQQPINHWDDEPDFVDIKPRSQKSVSPSTPVEEEPAGFSRGFEIGDKCIVPYWCGKSNVLGIIADRQDQRWGIRIVEWWKLTGISESSLTQEDKDEIFLWLESDKILPYVEGQFENPLEKSRASGWLEKRTKTIKGVTYPRVKGFRDEDNPDHWYWEYRYEEKSDKSTSDNGFVTRSVYLNGNLRKKIDAIMTAIALKWSIQKILAFIRGELDFK